jgi:hypothetical protein
MNALLSYSKKHFIAIVVELRFPVYFFVVLGYEIPQNNKKNTQKPGLTLYKLRGLLLDFDRCLAENEGRL